MYFLKLTKQFKVELQEKPSALKGSFMFDEHFIVSSEILLHSLHGELHGLRVCKMKVHLLNGTLS